MQQSFLLSLLVQDHPGVLQRICMLFSKRGFNIASITVGGSEQAGLSRMTIRTYGDRHVMQQMIHQVNKLIDVIQVEPIEQPYERELVLLKIETGDMDCLELAQLTGSFGGKMNHLEDDTCIVEMSGDMHDVQWFLEAMQRYPIVQSVRTGVAAISATRS
ncbi:acetolactate synthase small subunit [Paenibacillus andongensis]|uniref:acetolactate synthase small subunit n=1 Tax=Paenibacillus andongensis TaxID=2975482 RepID=UPI0021BADB0F|nr:acetolactate synthase small subunit [Paenibacillus andongensis]